MYIHERDHWTNFRRDASKVSLLLESVSRKQGLLYGRLSSLGFDSRLRAMAENLTYDVVCSSEIEGRDIQDLVAKNILTEDVPGAKRPSYSIVYHAEDLTRFFTEISVVQSAQ